MAIRVHPLVCRVKVIPQMENLCQVHVYCFGDANQPSHPLTPSSPALNLSQHQGLFQWVSCSHQMTKILEFQLQHLSFQRVKIDWFDLLAVQRTLRSLLQHHSSKASILPCSAFFTVQLSQAYMITGKTIALTLQTLVGREMSPLFNSQVCHSFLVKKRSSSDFMAAVTVCSDFRAQEEKICHYFHLFSLCLPWSNGADAMILVF